MNNLTTLVVGCGRSGTTFISSALKASGLNAAHESAFDVYGINPKACNDIECSWYAVPYLPVLSKKIKILHVYRRPEKVIASFYKFGILSKYPWRHMSKGKSIKFSSRLILHPNDAWPRVLFSLQHRDFLKRHLEINHWKNHSELELLEKYWFTWNRKILDHAQQINVKYASVNIDNILHERAKLEDFFDHPIQVNVKSGKNLKNDYKDRQMASEWRPSMETEKLWDRIANVRSMII